MRERDVGNQSAAEKGADAPFGAIEKLIGHDDIERLELLFQAADRAGRKNPLDAEHFKTVDVGAKVQLRRHDPVTSAVPGEERHPFTAKRADHVWTRWIAKRRLDCLLLPVGQLRHVVQTASADDADLNSHTIAGSSTRSRVSGLTRPLGYVRVGTS